MVAMVGGTTRAGASAGATKGRSGGGGGGAMAWRLADADRQLQSSRAEKRACCIYYIKCTVFWLLHLDCRAYHTPFLPRRMLVSVIP